MEMKGMETTKVIRTRLMIGEALGRDVLYAAVTIFVLSVHSDMTGGTFYCNTTFML